MCGIAGILSQNHKVDKTRLKQMTDAIAHRGPDGEGFWINPAENVGFGHRRLAIIDLSETGKQPMFYANGRYVLTFNGEIYNYIELRDQLEARGCEFVSTSDTEVLLALYDQKKERCLDDLDGMFAFAIWDEQEQRLFVARDRFGEKPFYYAIHENVLYFASEMKALWVAGVPRHVSNTMLFNYLSNNFTYNPNDLTETFYEGIFKLKAAHYSYVSPSDMRMNENRYWSIDPENVDQNISEVDAKDQFRKLFFESVNHRLRADVPVGSSLSGGLDSSLIVCAIDSLNNDKQRRQATFSARFPGFAKDEGKYMQAVIDRTNVEPHFVYPDENGLTDNLEKLFYHQEEPFGSASIYAQYCVMALAKENNVTVLLDGQGADELLAGYHPYIDNYLGELRSRDKAIWQRETQAHRDLYGMRNGRSNLRETAMIYMPERLKDSARRFRNRLPSRTPFFLNNDFQRANSASSFHYPRRPDSLQAALYRDACGGPLEELLRYADRNSMAHSREVRLPFLHFRLAEFLFSLPASFKIHNGVYKYIMREAFRDLLPTAIAGRTDKVGYEPPQKSWLADPRMTDRVNSGAHSLAAAGILNPKTLDLIQSLEENTTIFTSYNWKILMAANLLEF